METLSLYGWPSAGALTISVGPPWTISVTASCAVTPVKLLAETVSV